MESKDARVLVAEWGGERGVSLLQSGYRLQKGMALTGLVAWKPAALEEIQPLSL